MFANVGFHISLFALCLHLVSAENEWTESVSSSPTLSPTLMGDYDCTLTNTFGQAVQVVLAFMVLIVLSTEYLVECVRAWYLNRTAKRDVFQFWFDVFKIACGAALSHLFNVLISMYLSSNGADECALYALAFVYEGSGVPFVQLFTYCVIRYAQTKKDSQFWIAVSTPGVYNHKPGEIKRQLNPWSWSFRTRFLLAMIPATLCLLLGIGLKWGFLVTYVGPIFGFMFFFSACYTTYNARMQVLTWCCIKTIEKGIWTGFVVAQSRYFEDWSIIMEMKDTQTQQELEAIYYVCLIPIAMNAFMFFMFSRISRLQLPCITVKDKRRSSREMEKFDMLEGLKVGVVFCLMMNSMLWLGCSLAFRQLNVIIVLLVSMLILPFVMCLALLFLGRYCVDRSYARSGYSSFRNEAQIKSNSVPLIPAEFNNEHTSSQLPSES